MFHTVFVITIGMLVFFSGLLGLYILTRNPKMKINWLWALVNFSITIWALGYLTIILTGDAEITKLMIDLIYLATILMPVFYFHAVVIFLIKNVQYNNTVKLGYLLAIILLIIFFTTNWIVSGIQHTSSFGYFEIAGFLYPLYIVYLTFFMLHGLHLLFKNYYETTGVYKRKTKYIIIAALIVMVGGMFNFVTIYFQIYPYPMMIVFTYPFLIYYGIFMDGVSFKILR